MEFPKAICPICGVDSIEVSQPVITEKPGMGMLATRRTRCAQHGWHVELHVSEDAPDDVVQSLLDAIEEEQKRRGGK